MRALTHIQWEKNKKVRLENKAYCTLNKLYSVLLGSFLNLAVLLTPKMIKIGYSNAVSKIFVT